MLNISHTIYPENKAEDFNIWMNNIYSRPKQEDLSINTLNKNKIINCKKPLGYFYLKAEHKIYKSLTEIFLKL